MELKTEQGIRAMDKFVGFIVDKRKFFFVLFLTLIVLSALLLPSVNINYDLAKYLPDGTPSKTGLQIIRNEYDLPTSAQAMVRDISIPDAMDLKKEMEGVSGVSGVMWLNDVTDITQPLSLADPDVVDAYYKDNDALFDISFENEADSGVTRGAINDLYALLGDRSSLRGDAVDSKEIDEIVNQQMNMITIITVIAVLVILLLLTSSWIEPIVFILVIGTSIALNMGTNAALPSISYITNSMCVALQLAISMDYSIFLLHRFEQEREGGADSKAAMKTALRRTLSTVSASALTTLAGFVALTFMRFSLGSDLGWVFAKGIVLSFLSVVFFMPSLVMFFSGAIHKTRHRPLLPPFHKAGRAVVKIRWPVLVAALVIFVPAFLGQRANSYIYGGTSVTAAEDSRVTQDKEAIAAVFGEGDTIALLVPKEDIPRQAELTRDLKNVPYVDSVTSLVSVAPEKVPYDLLPKSLTENFESKNYTRVIVKLDAKQESAEAFSALEGIKKIADEYYSGQYSTTGMTAISKDIKDVVDVDYNWINLLSIAAVGVIIALTFRSVLLPFLLVATIEIAIALNTCMPYFMGEKPMFVGFVIISAIQLGATIDYAILMTSRHLENRRHMDAKSAAAAAFGQAGGSIFTSALIMTAAGLMLWRVSSIETISQTGLLLGRGALLSCVMVFLLLPALLVVFDRPIRKLTYKAGFTISGREKDEK
jgi:predicted RND superfamily exporter protein